jgi:hypothetical protein
MAGGPHLLSCVRYVYRQSKIGSNPGRVVTGGRGVAFFLGSVAPHGVGRVGVVGKTASTTLR